MNKSPKLRGDNSTGFCFCRCIQLEDLTLCWRQASYNSDVTVSSATYTINQPRCSHWQTGRGLFFYCLQVHWKRFSEKCKSHNLLVRFIAMANMDDHHFRRVTTKKHRRHQARHHVHQINQLHSEFGKFWISNPRAWLVKVWTDLAGNAYSCFVHRAWKRL